jgi:predicted DNA-binding protein
MARQYSVICDDEVGERVAALAREYDLTEEAVLRQLIERGLEQAERERPEMTE